MLPLTLALVLAVTGCQNEDDRAPKPASGEAAAARQQVDEVVKTEQSRAEAFRFGAKLSLLVMTRAKGVEKDTLTSLQQEVDEVAESLEVTLPGFYKLSNNPVQDEAAAVDYLLKIVAKELGPELSEKQGPESAALLEFAVKTNLLLLLYIPGDASNPETNSAALLTAAETAATRAGVPRDSYIRQFELIRLGAGYEEMRRAIQQAHENVYTHLVTPAK